jgi:NAD(P)H-nitrite reductase large subunit
MNHDDCPKYDCVCFGVSKEKLKEIIDENSCKDIHEVHNFSLAGRSCGMCVPFIEDYIERKKNDPPNSV